MELSQLFNQVPERESFHAGTVIFTEGDPAQTMYLIVEGQVRLSLQGEPMAMAVAGGFVGEMALIDKSPRSATATALTDCVLAPIDRDRFLDMLRTTPEFALLVMAVLTDRLRLANEILASA